MKTGKALVTLLAGTLMALSWAASSAAPPPGTRFVGCFRDSENRDLKFEAGTMGGLPQSCTDTCRQKGYKFAGTQYGSYCFCGNEYGKQGPADNCNTPCFGNPSEMCGGSWANSVYELLTASPPPPTGGSVPGGSVPGGSTSGVGEYKGCFRDNEDRDLRFYGATSSQTTVQSCAATCSAKGYRYAGLQYGSYCFCGSEYGKYGPADNCNFPCAGDASQTCGGSWANSVYDLMGSSAKVPPTLPPPQQQLGLTGVWRDENGATYAIREVGNQVWWYMDGRPRYTNVFRGNRSGNTITGEWVDVPGGRVEGNIIGSLTLQVIDNDVLRKVSSSPAYGATTLSRLYWDASP